MKKAAIYCRLSEEDKNKLCATDDSGSIQNQKAMLVQYAEEQGWEVYQIYSDDDYTGADRRRPQFKRLLKDAEQHKFDIILCKTQSRFTRELELVEKYIHGLFPIWGIRFVSIVDNADTDNKGNKKSRQINGLVNEWYLEDMSDNIRSVLTNRRVNGLHIGAFALYGYRKDPDDHSRLLIDEAAAAVVRDIFNWFIGGTSVLGIAKRLNEQGVPNPSAYKRQQGMNYRHPTSDRLDDLWPDSSVRRILRNPLYTGTMVQGKNRMKSYKLHISEAVPEDEWITVAQTHEAIIPIELFDKAQALFERDTRTAPTQPKVYLFSGFLRCADCGKAMNRKLISQPHRDYYYYICSTFKKQHSGACTKHTIRSDRLEQAVLETLRSQIALAVEMDELIAEINRSGARSRSADHLQTERAQLETERERIEQMKLSLYPDWKAGDISREEYHRLKEQFEQQQARLDTRIASLQTRIDEAQNGVDETNSFLSQFIKYRNLQTLTREVIVELIDMIYVHEGGKITIKFKFSDAYAAVQDYIRKHGKTA